MTSKTFYLFLLTEYEIYAQHRMTQDAMYMFQDIETIKLLEMIQVNCFQHCLDTRFDMAKEYNPMYVVHDMNPFYAFILDHVTEFTCMALMNQCKQNTSVASLIRSRIRVSMNYNAKKVIALCCKREQSRIYSLVSFGNF